jgi:glycosyltransferase involved in cell wall biosynthesis
MSGGEIALLHLVIALDHSRFKPVVVLAADGPLRARLEAAQITTVIVPLSGSVTKVAKDSLGVKSLLKVGTILRIVHYIFRLRRVFRESGADLVHTNSLKADIIGGAAARLAGVKVLWHVRDRIAEDYLPRPVVHVFRRLCRLAPNVLVANSHATMRTLGIAPDADGQGYTRAGRNDCHVVHDGVPDHESPEPTAAPSDPLRRIGLVGRISPWKGQHIFIAAVAQVRRQFPEARFQIIGAPLFGEEVYGEQVRRQVTELGLDDCLEFTGFRTDVPALIRKLDILVHASTIGEPFGQVVTEGMVAGKPVVATDGGGVPEIVEAGVTGLLVPMGDVDALAGAMVTLLSDPVRARAMGVAARMRVLDQFTVAHTARNMEAVYDTVLNADRQVSVISQQRSEASS